MHGTIKMCWFIDTPLSLFVYATGVLAAKVTHNAHWLKKITNNALLPIYSLINDVKEESPLSRINMEPLPWNWVSLAVVNMFVERIEIGSSKYIAGYLIHSFRCINWSSVVSYLGYWLLHFDCEFLNKFIFHANSIERRKREKFDVLTTANDV